MQQSISHPKWQLLTWELSPRRALESCTPSLGIQHYRKQAWLGWIELPACLGQ
jgi:hypothetical protein